VLVAVCGDFCLLCDYVQLHYPCIVLHVPFVLIQYIYLVLLVKWVASVDERIMVF